jgi:hypothetical protein
VAKELSSPHPRSSRALIQGALEPSSKEGALEPSSKEGALEPSSKELSSPHPDEGSDLVRVVECDVGECAVHPLAVILKRLE